MASKVGEKGVALLETVRNAPLKLPLCTPLNSSSRWQSCYANIFQKPDKLSTGLADLFFLQHILTFLHRLEFAVAKVSNSQYSSLYRLPHFFFVTTADLDRKIGRNTLYIQGDDQIASQCSLPPLPLFPPGADEGESRITTKADIESHPVEQYK